MKRKLTLLICCLTILTSSLPVYAAEKPQDAIVIQNDANVQVSPQKEYPPGYYKVTGTGVRFRSSPGLSGSIIATLNKDAYVYYERAAGRQLRPMDTHGYVVNFIHLERSDTSQ